MRRRLVQVAGGCACLIFTGFAVASDALARILLAIACIQPKAKRRAVELLTELSSKFPASPSLRREILRLHEIFAFAKRRITICPAPGIHQKFTAL
jgi:hypothetical protein